MLGFSRRDIYGLVMGELTLLTIAAMPLGCALGYAFSWTLTEGTANEIFRTPLHLEPRAYGFAILFALVSVAASSGVVLSQLNRLDIVEVLKTQE